MHEKLSSNFEKTMENNKSKIYRICTIYAVAPIEPDDLFQEVTYNLWRSFTSFANKSDINTWVYRVALNVCMRYKNRLVKKHGSLTRLDSIRFDPPATESDPAMQVKLKALNSCIQTLDLKDQSIVALSLEGLPYKAISKITGLTENHVAVKMKRIKQKLLKCIHSKLNDDE